MPSDANGNLLGDGVWDYSYDQANRLVEAHSTAAGPNVAPAAAVTVAAGQARGVVPLEVHFDASGSWDHDGDIVSYGWDFDGDTTVDATTTQATVSHTYAVAGEVAATVTVTDDDGSTDTASVVVEALADGPVTETVEIPADGELGPDWTNRSGIFSADGEDASVQIPPVGTYTAEQMYATFSAAAIDAAVPDSATVTRVAFKVAGHVSGTENNFRVRGQLWRAGSGQYGPVHVHQSTTETTSVSEWASTDVDGRQWGHRSGLYATAGFALDIEATRNSGLFGPTNTAYVDQVVLVVEYESDSGGNVAPSAAVTSSPDPPSGPAPLAVAFDASASVDVDGTVVAYSWDFDGDSQTDSTTSTPVSSHVYADPGVYTARVTVTDGDGATATASRVVEVSVPTTVTRTVEIAADGNLGPDWQNRPNTHVTDGVYGTAPIGPVFAYTVRQMYATFSQAAVDAAVPADAVVTGVAFKLGGRISGTHNGFRVRGQLFEAGSGQFGPELTFRATTDDVGQSGWASTDIDDNVWGDRSSLYASGGFGIDIEATRNAGLFTPSHTAFLDGVSLVVSYSTAVANWAPVAALSSTPDPPRGPVPLTVELDAGVSRDPDGTVVAYSWDFDGDGTIDDTTSGPSVSHTYTDVGESTATVTVTDDDGGTDTASVVVEAVADGPATETVEIAADGSVGPDWTGRDNIFSADDQDASAQIGPVGTFAAEQMYATFSAAAVDAAVPDRARVTRVGFALRGRVSGTEDNFGVRGQLYRAGSGQYGPVTTLRATTAAWVRSEWAGTDIGSSPWMHRSRLYDSAGLRVDVEAVRSAGISGPANTAFVDQVVLVVEYETASAANIAPTAAVATDPAPAQGEAPLTVGFDASASVDADGTIVAYRWDYDGDGTTDTETVSPQGTYTYTYPGDYTARVSVVDGDGGTDTATVAVEVAAPSVQTTTVEIAADGNAGPHWSARHNIGAADGANSTAQIAPVGTYTAAQMYATFSQSAVDAAIPAGATVTQVGFKLRGRISGTDNNFAIRGQFHDAASGQYGPQVTLRATTDDVAQSASATLAVDNTAWGDRSRLYDSAGFALDIEATRNSGLFTPTHTAYVDQVVLVVDYTTAPTTTTQRRETHSYSGDGRRYRTTTTDGAGRIVDDVGYRWDPNRQVAALVAETAPDGTPVRSHTYGHGLITTQSGTTQTTYHPDRLGSTRTTTTTGGGGPVAVASYSYDPYGTLRHKSEPAGTASTRFGFAGQYGSPTTGLLHLRARDYQPGTGRFLSVDPLARPLDRPWVNAYSYADANPTGLVDPTGMRGQRPEGTWTDLDGNTFAAAGVPDGMVCGRDACGPLSPFAQTMGQLLDNIDGHAILDVAGMIPYVGEVFDYANAAWYAADGDYANAAISAVAMVPLAGDALKGLRLGGKAIAAIKSLRFVDETIAALKGLRRPARTIDTAKTTRTIFRNTTRLDAPTPTRIAKATTSPTAPRYVYRGGSKTADNLTPRPGADTTGLLTFDNLEAAVKPGGKAQVIDTTKLKCTVACRDAPPPGHVSIAPRDPAEIAEWAATRGTGKVHPYTQDILDAWVETVRRPK